MTDTLLSVETIRAGYGDISVLEDISLHVDEGEVVSILGANGAGKTTLLRAITGLVGCTAGSVSFRGERIDTLPAHRVVARGIAMVPEGGRLFPFMTVEENLELGAFADRGRKELARTMDEVMELFPILRERRAQMAGVLSGGERQMCAIARGVMSKPDLLMLDEPSLGLAPVMVERLFALIRTLADQRGLTILLVEQNVADALEMSGRAYILDRGRIVQEGSGETLLADEGIQRAYMGL